MLLAKNDNKAQISWRLKVSNLFRGRLELPNVRSSIGLTYSIAHFFKVID